MLLGSSETWVLRASLSMLQKQPGESQQHTSGQDWFLSRGPEEVVIYPEGPVEGKERGSGQAVVSSRADSTNSSPRQFVHILSSSTL